jgi:hypothetical protein
MCPSFIYYVGSKFHYLGNVKTAEYLSSECISLAYPGLKPDREKIQDIANRLESLKLGTDDRVVLDLLSNAAYMGTDGDGLPTPSYRRGMAATTSSGP